MQLGPQTLSEASVRQVWGELLAASAKGGKGVKLEGAESRQHSVPCPLWTPCRAHSS